MKNTVKNIAFLVAIVAFLVAAGYNCSGTKKSAETGNVEIISTNVNGSGLSIRMEFLKGQSHNHPLMVVWIEDTNGRYIETLYIAESIGTGVFEHGKKSDGQWEAGEVRRPAALPYWGHKRGIKAADGYYLPTPEEPMPDAVTGPTPPGDFILESKTSEKAPRVFKIMMEINQSWDWNEYWTNNKFPDDAGYKSSSQPSLVYEATINPDLPEKEYLMKPAGHGHYSGMNGSLTTDLSTITSALEIAKSIKVILD